MTRHINSWIALALWATVMAIVWALFVPGSLSIGTFALLGLAGPVVLISALVLLRTQRPPISVGRILADMEAVRSSSRGPR